MMSSLGTSTAEQIQTFTIEELAKVEVTPISISQDQEGANWMVVENNQLDHMNWKAIEEQLKSEAKDRRQRESQQLLEIDASLNLWINARLQPKKDSAIDSIPLPTLNLVKHEDRGCKRKAGPKKKVSGTRKPAMANEMGSKKTSKKRKAEAKSDEKPAKLPRVLMNSSTSNVTTNPNQKPLYLSDAKDFKDKDTRMRIIRSKQAKISRLKIQEQMVRLKNENQKLLEENILLKNEVTELKLQAKLI